MIDDPTYTNIPDKAGDEWFVTTAMTVLQKHYPGHPWLVEANASQGQLTIRHPLLAKRRGMRLHMRNLKTTLDLEMRVMRAGGEFLEIFGVKRGGPIDEDLLVGMGKLAFLH